MSDAKIYQMTRQDYDALVGHLKQIQSILSHAVVVDAPVATPVPSKQVVPTTLQHLNSATLCDVFGINYRGILYYDFETNAWSDNKYGGYSVFAPMYPEDISSSIAPHRSAQGGTSVIALAVMTMNGAFFQGWCESVSNPVYSARGTSVVANLVRRDNVTGKIIPVSNNWVGIADMSDHHSAVKRCFAVPDLLASRSVLLNTLVDMSQRQK